jgi:hypothetical protein
MGRRLSLCFALALSMLTPSLAADAEVFSGRVVSTDRNRYRLRVKTQSGQRVVWVSVKNVWQGGTLIGRKVLKPGQKVLVTAQKHRKEWRASRVQIL